MLKYYEKMLPILTRAFESQGTTLLQAAELIADTVQSDRLIYLFGAGHAGILSQEMIYRAGGLVPMVPIFPPGLTPTMRPMTLGTEMERIPGYAKKIIEAYELESDAVMIIHSNSGRNIVPVEMAQIARKKGLKIIALTNVAQCRSAAAKTADGIKLIDTADILIDNCGENGDACVTLEPIGETVGATSTVVGAALLNAVIVEAAQIMLNRGFTPPIFRSANLDSNDYQESNRRWMSHYGKRLLYL